MSLNGFGKILDIKTGVWRDYYVKEGVKYWVDNDKKVEE